MTTATLKLGGAYPHRHMDGLCRELSQVLADRSAAPPRLDMSELRSLAPANLSLLLASIAERYPQLGPASLAVPSDGSALACLREQTLATLMTEEADHWEEGSTGTITGSLLFSARMEVYPFLGRLAAFLQARAGLGSDAQGAVHFLLFELISNAVQYSGVPRGAAVVELDPANRRLALAVADCGMGVRTSLSRNPAIEVPDDLSALAAAVRPAQTGDPIHGDGMGLSQARWMVEKNGGAFLLRSGDACHERRPEISNREDLPRLFGTVVSARLRCDGPLDYSTIDDTLREPRGIGESLEP
jgi:signal transduction histidine kinase